MKLNEEELKKIGSHLVNGYPSRSSKLIIGCALGHMEKVALTGTPNTPYDFSQCDNLVKAVPLALKIATPKLIKLHKEWELVIENWAALSAATEEDRRDGTTGDYPNSFYAVYEGSVSDG